MKVVIIGQPSQYITMLNRSAMLSDTEIVAVYSDINQMTNNIDIVAADCIVATNTLYAGSLQEVVEELEKRNKINLLYCLLDNPDEDIKQYLQLRDIPFKIQTQISPMEFIEDLQSGKLHPGPARREEIIQKTQSNISKIESRGNNYEEQAETVGVQKSQQNFGQGGNEYSNPQNGNMPSWRANAMVSNLEAEESSLQQKREQFMQGGNDINASYLGDKNIDYTKAVDQRFNQPNLDTRTGYGEYQNPSNQLNMQRYKKVCICINSPKGGVGKTTLAVELSSLIANRAKELDINEVGELDFNKRIRVALLDMNTSFDTMSSIIPAIYNVRNHPSVSSWFQTIEQKILDSLETKTRQEIIRNGYQGLEKYLDPKKIFFTRDEVEKLTVYDESVGLHIVPSINLPIDAQSAFPEYLDIIINTMKEYFDVLLIDTGNNLTTFTMESMRLSDIILLVCTKSKGSAMTIDKLKNDLKLRRDPIDESKFNLILNSPNGGSAIYEAQSFQSSLNMHLAADIPYDEKVREAHEAGEYYAVFNPRSKYAQACIKLGQSICPVWNVVPNRNSPKKKQKKRHGLFRR